MAGKKKRAKSTGVLILGLAVLIGALTAGPGRVYGAGAIDTERKDCKITFTLDVEALEKAGELAGLETAAPGYEQYYGELAAWLKGSDAQDGTEAGEQEGDTAPGQEEGNVPGEPGEGSASGENAIQAELYRIAEVNAGGKYTLLAPWKSAEALKGVETADSSTPENGWHGRKRLRRKLWEQNRRTERSCRRRTVFLYLAKVRKSAWERTERFRGLRRILRPACTWYGWSRWIRTITVTASYHT